MDNENTVIDISTPEKLAEYAVKVLDEKKAKDIKLLHVEEHTIIADNYVICTGSSVTQLRSLADEVEFRMTEAGNPPTRIEGDGSGGWILLDFASLIVHIFSSQSREFYNIEKLFGEDSAVDISSLLTDD